MADNPISSSVHSLPEPVALAVEGFGDLPTMAPVAMKVLEMADNPDVSMGELCQIIGTDPSLTVRLLHLANSAAYYRGSEVTTLERAASLLGIRTLKLVSLCFSLVADLRDDRLDWVKLWRRSVASGVMARRITGHPVVAARLGSQRAQPGDGSVEEAMETAFVAGLLAEVGRFTLPAMEPGRTLVDDHGTFPGPTRERAALGVTVDAITAAVLQRWGLPSTIVDAVAARHPTEAPSAPPVLARALRVADAAAELIFEEEEEDTAARVVALDALTATSVSLGLTVGQIEELIDEGHEELDQLLGAFELELPGMLDADDLISSAQRQFARISLDSAISRLRIDQGDGSAAGVEAPSLVSTDPLTGLPNRRAMETFLANRLALATLDETSSNLGLLVVQLDGFREIQSSFGAIASDELLQGLGWRLADTSERSSLLARFGAERFVVVSTEGAADGLLGAADRIRSLVAAEPFASSSTDVDLTVSCGGVAVTSALTASPTDLLASAAVELERSVAAGGNRSSVRVLS